MGYLGGFKAISARIEYFDAPTTDFPDLNFNIAHLNYGDVNTLGNIMLFKENVFCDFAGIGQNLIMYSPPDFYRILRYLMNLGPVSSKVMFGSDWTGQPNSEWVETIKNLNNSEISAILKNYGYRKFKSKEIKKMLGKNTAHFLNL